MSRVLVVEDDASIRDITALALRSAGHTVDTAASGPQALALLEHETVDVILLDVRMPLMDGAEFARRYRERTPAPAPIIVLTAARDSTMARAEFQASRFIEKPFDLEALLGAIEDVAGARTNH